MVHLFTIMLSSLGLCHSAQVSLFFDNREVLLDGKEHAHSSSLDQLSLEQASLRFSNGRRNGSKWPQRFRRDLGHKCFSTE